VNHAGRKRRHLPLAWVELLLRRSTVGSCRTEVIAPRLSAHYARLRLVSPPLSAATGVPWDAGGTSWRGSPRGIAGQCAPTGFSNDADDSAMFHVEHFPDSAPPTCGPRIRPPNKLYRRVAQDGRCPRRPISYFVGGLCLRSREPASAHRWTSNSWSAPERKLRCGH
jgi:hypothetical protein